MKSIDTRIAPYLNTLRSLDFVNSVALQKETVASKGLRLDGELTISTPKGKYPFIVEQKNSYLDRTFIHGLLAQVNNHHRSSAKPILLFAKYVPEPSAETLIQNGINFVDKVGNMHLVMGSNYSRTIVGKKEQTITNEGRPITAAGIQLLFTYAANEAAGAWSVRELASASGIGKSNVASIRSQLVDKGLLQKSAGVFRIVNKKEFEQDLLRGYGEILRPKLFINRFRAADSSNQRIVKEISSTLTRLDIRWSLSGGPAAYNLQHFYQGAEIPLFIDGFSDVTLRELRWLPDAQGPIILLQSFGSAPYWKQSNGGFIAHPWLIYSELMYSADARAHEAANELRVEFLKW